MGGRRRARQREGEGETKGQREMVKDVEMKADEMTRTCKPKSKSHNGEETEKIMKK